MAAPVITSKLTWDVVVEHNMHYQIRATNFPTSFLATNMVPKMTINLTTGQLYAKVHVAGVYNVNISATNDDGTGEAVLVVTATDDGLPPPPPGESTGVTVYPAKYWSDHDPEERIDYADLDSAGQPIASFEAESIGADQLTADAITNKVTAVGGPGRVGKYVFLLDRPMVFPARFLVQIGSVRMIGVKAGDIVVMGELLTPENEFIITPLVYWGATVANEIRIYAYSAAGTSYNFRAGSRLNFRVFGFPTG